MEKLSETITKRPTPRDLGIITSYVGSEVVDALNELATMLGKSKSKLVRQAIVEFVNRQVEQG